MRRKMPCTERVESPWLIQCCIMNDCNYVMTMAWCRAGSHDPLDVPSARTGKIVTLPELLCQHFRLSRHIQIPSPAAISTLRTALTMSLAASRAVLRQSTFAVRRAGVRNASNTSEAAGAVKEKASEASSKASEGLTKVTSSASSAASKVGSTASDAANATSGRVGGIVGRVQG